MKKFIISEQEKQRILEMHQSATSRQYLMEQTIASTQAPVFVNEFNRVMTAYKLPGYVAKFVKGADDYHGNIVIYKDGKELVKSPQDFGIAVTANLSQGVQQTKDPLDNYGTQLVDGKVTQFGQSLEKVLGTADAAAKNQLATAVRSAVDAVKKQLKPTQKESDLRRIVKRVMNERNYLMEEEVATNYFNTMKTKFDGQMTAYKLPTITLQLNNNGTISIVKDGKAVYTSTVSPDVPTLSQAISYNEAVKGSTIPTVKLSSLLLPNLVNGYTNYVKSTPNANLTLGPVTGALRSAVTEVVNTYFKNKQPAQPK